MNPTDKAFYIKLATASAVLLAVYAAGTVFLCDGCTAANPSPALTAFGNLMQCLLPLIASAALLSNAASSNWRRNAFWMLLSLGCTLWLAGQLLWTYYEIHLRQPVPNPFIGDVVFFLHTVPMIAALAMRPDARRVESSFRVGYLDFLFLLLWWLYLYLFVVIPWQYIQDSVEHYGASYNLLYLVENIVFVLGLGWLWWRGQGHWRKVYLHLFCAAGAYTLGSMLINAAIDQKKYYTGSVLDLPLVGSFVWFGAAGLLARHWERSSERTAADDPAQGPEYWPARLAMVAILSLPLMATWVERSRDLPEAVQSFRFLLTMAAIIVFSSLLLVRQMMAERERQHLLHEAHAALENLRRLQSQFVQSERMASLGQLAAGAAHEINNPLTAILGFADVLGDDHSLGEKQRGMVDRIREQARRTKTLLNNLLSFARQAPSEKSLLDVNPVINNAVQLRSLDLRAKNIRIHVQAEAVLPAVRGDVNQMLQVFFNLISNAVDAMEETNGGTLTVITKREKNSVVVEFSDTGPGISRPELVFDPFYTTKPVGKGTGLGLSICYGIVKEHDGNITCFNRHQGGATFRVELPAATAVLPKPTLETESRPRAL